MEQAEIVLRQAETFRQSGRYDEAIACLRAMLEARPDLASAHNNLGLVWIGKQDYRKAVACFHEALRIRRNFAEAYCNLGTALLIQGDPQAGEAAIEEALRIKPDFALAHVNRAAMWLRKGDFEHGLPKFEWRRLGTPNLHAQVQAPLWDGAASVNSSILLVAEHGIGDTLHFVRYAPLVRRRCGRVVLQCRNSLVPLLRQCPGIDRCASPDEALPRCDFHAPLMSLPLLLGTTLLTVPADVPYVHARRDLAEAWQERLSRYSGYKVGIAWQGNPRYPTDNLRSIPVRHFRPLARVPNVALFSLQKGAGADQLAGLGPDFPVVEFGGEFDASTGGFMDTAAVMQNLDLVITSDTAVAHLAGAMGIPVWVALCKSADWRWLEERDDSPWYPTMRLFRQAELGDWGALFERMAAELKLVLDGEKSRLSPLRPPVLEIHAPTGAGELLDRICILEIKCRRIAHDERREAAQSELAALTAVRDRTIRTTAEIESLVAALQILHERLWEAEDKIRGCERRQDFGPRFVELARIIYLSNDERLAVKQQINTILRSSIREVREYSSDLPTEPGRAGYERPGRDLPQEREPPGDPEAVAG